MEVSLVKHTIAYEAVGWAPWRYVAAWGANIFWTHHFMRSVYRHCDTIGLNYYHHTVFGDTRTLEKTDMGWNIDPRGITTALRILARYELPIHITEAGCADAHDRFRADYIRGLVRGVRDALNVGIPVRSFLYWSLLDNYEWAEGFDKRFGLIEVNYETLERTIRPSAYVYKEIIESDDSL
jgi:beta-glucosidase